jgi:hypothetical protein
MKILVSVVLLALLCGCTAGGEKIINLAPVCEALGAPILYNPGNTASVWHAGKSLAAAIDQRNDVGANLRCPGY